MATIGRTQMGNNLPTVIAQKALGYLPASLHLVNTVARDTDFRPMRQGDRVRVAKRGSLTANDKAEDTSVTFQNPALTNVDVLLNKHKEVTIAFEDVVEPIKEGGFDVRTGYIEDAMLTLGEAMETDLAALITGISGTVGTAGTDITDAVMLEARSALTNNRAPIDNRYLLLAPDQLNVILGLDKFIGADKYGSNVPVQQGEFGSIYGMKVMEGLFVPVTAGTPDTIHNVAYHRDAFVLATRPLPTPQAPGVQVGYATMNGITIRVLISYNGALLADQITIDVLYGVAELRDELGTQVLA